MSRATTQPSAEEITLVQFAIEWYGVKTAGLRQKSATVYRTTINSHIAPFFQNIRLTDITPMMVRKLMAEKSELARSTQSKILYTLKQIFSLAVESEIIKKNPAENIKPGGARAKEKVPLSGEQQEELLRLAAGTRAEVFTKLCLFAGLRREEALGLLWDSVHMDSDTPYLEVRHTVSEGKHGAEHTAKLKSRAARRSIPMPEVLTSALMGARKTKSSRYVVPKATNGSFMTGTAFKKMWTPLKKKVSFNVHPHLLRHTYITELCASGMDIKKIQYLAGHEDVTMTLRVYAHVKENSPQELSEEIINIFKRE
ncbi:site-specific integrase [Clostridia bacterium]|nr:site-specific integrase [Clostridia bacterium]